MEKKARGQPMVGDFNKKEFLAFIKRLDEILDKPIYIIAIGGSALSLINLKDKTKDMDFFVAGIDFEDFDALIEKVAEKENIPKRKIDYWMDGEILFVKGAWQGSKLPPDYIKLTLDYKKVKLKHITLKILNPVDLIITKVGRSNPVDITDITNLIRVYKIDKKLLTERFAYFLNNFKGNKSLLQANFNRIIKQNYGDK